jgi:3-hydroxyacyl-CoA dehydrogenase / enoyl-CoA hydratase / 3-hydroxybutyryl-CoA epimerase
LTDSTPPPRTDSPAASPAFRLEVAADGLATLTFDLPGKSANIFSRAAIFELERLVDGLAARRDIAALLLVSGKAKIFIAGADVEEIANLADASFASEASRHVQGIFRAWESLPFPTIAAVQGSCLGGGTELALACSYLVISDRADIRIGLPEIRLGIVPGWGGCVRLPRKIGLRAALDIILAGKAISAKSALQNGLADALLPDATFLAEAQAFARQQFGRQGRPPRRARGGWTSFLLEGNPLGRALVFRGARKQVLASTKGHYPAPLRALAIVETAISRGAAAGFAAEAQAIGELAISPISKNLVHIFHLMEAAKKPVAMPGGEARPVRSAAVLGAGVMGGGIGQLIAAQNVPVRLRDLVPQALAGGMKHAAALFAKEVARRRLSPAEARRKMALLHPTLALDGLRGADLVIEAIVEKLDVKQRTFAEVATLAPDAILATNTSSLSIAAIARDTPAPERVVGMHFFNPVDKMPLVEVVLGPETGAVAANTVAAFARQLGKTPIFVRECPGFLVNRILSFYLSEAMALLAEGHRIEDLDAAMLDWGMPMGPIALTDEVGVDVAVKVAGILGAAFGDRLPQQAAQHKLVDAGRLGTKTGRGFYRYRGRQRLAPDPSVYALLGLRPSIQNPDPVRLVERMVLPMVNEAARCLDENIVANAGHLDLAMILGTGFPPFRGGLCRWAEAEGLAKIVVDLERLAGSVGERYRASAALVTAAERGGLYRGD